MKKVLSVAAAAPLLCALAVAPARAQGGKVRVGPAPDEQPPAAKSEAKKATPPAETKQVKIEKTSEAKNAAKGETKPENKPEAKPETGKSAEESSVALSSNAADAASASAPPSDAPAKTTPATFVPVVEPSKGSASPKKAEDNSKAAENKSAPKSVPPPANPLKAENNSTPSTSPATNTNAAAPAKAAPSPTPSNSNSSNTGAPATPANGVSQPPAANPSPNNVTPSNTSAASPTNANPAATAAAAAAALPPTAVYRVGVGDVLDIRLLNQANSRESTLYTVMAGGLLEYPLAGDPLVASGMTTEEIAARLAAALKRRAVYERPQVVVSVQEYASHAVLVSGLVGDPGTKILRREAVPLYVVLAESQPHPEAGRAIIISHKTGQSATVDLSDPASMNVLVHAGDVVNVQPRPKEFFYIGGEISLGGQKDFHAGMTLTQALLAAGGTTRNAAGKVKVARQGADGRLVTTEYVLKDIEEGKVPDPRLQPGDRVEVVRKR